MACQKFVTVTNIVRVIRETTCKAQDKIYQISE